MNKDNRIFDDVKLIRIKDLRYNKQKEAKTKSEVKTTTKPAESPDFLKFISSSFPF